MDITPELRLRRRAWVAVGPDRAHELISDVTRMAEWSPNLVSAGYTDDARTEFTGVSRAGAHTWETTSRVVTSLPGKAFVWEVGDGIVRWTYSFSPERGGTVVEVSWELLKLLPVFGSTQADLLALRARTATGIEDTLIAFAASQS